MCEVKVADGLAAACTRNLSSNMHVVHGKLHAVMFRQQTSREFGEYGPDSVHLGVGTGEQVTIQISGNMRPRGVIEERIGSVWQLISAAASSRRRQAIEGVPDHVPYFGFHRMAET